MQLDLRPEPLSACPWARKPKYGTGVVLAVPMPLPYVQAPPLRSQGWSLHKFAIDRGQAAAWLVGGNDAELLSWMPGPPAQGSRTPGILLPW